ncbi:MAG: NADH-quinone oxidoreductase subunit NuoH [Elusimicrobia bacterium]|nr:NADH-quinone oxidoreductase subunit NuoH [Elusimicrobiota bacterium]
MASGPWAVTGPWSASQTPAAIRRRYFRSVLVLAAILAPLFAITVLVGEPDKYFHKILDLLTAFVEKKGGPAWIPTAVTIAVPCMVVLGLIQVLPIFLVWWEMKIAAHIQVRLGPMRVGRFHGILQTIADGIKLLLKEDLIPEGADRKIHFIAPVIAVAPALVCFAPIPLGHAGLAPVGLDVGLLFVLGVSGLSVIGLLMAGWGSNNKYSMLGGLRAAAQVVSYEIPRVISVLPVVMWAGTLSLGGIAAHQGDLWQGFLPKWFIFYPVVGQVSFIVYLIASIAETNRTPFDIAEAESELTSGFHTEYSGMKWAMFFMAEYAYMFLACALGAVLFLGGGGAPHPRLNFIPSYVWFFGKTFFLAFLFILFRWSYPRLRVDRLMEFCWKFLLPWSLGNVALAGFLFLMRSR